MIKSYIKAFTLIELLIVIAVIAILAVGAFVALNPGKRLADTRDATRWNDVTALLDAVKVDQVDNGGTYVQDTTATPPVNVNTLTAGTAYMIGTCAAGVGTCTSIACTDQAIAVATNGVDLVISGGAPTAGLVEEGYLASIPIAQSAPGNSSWTAALTGYYLIRNANGTIKVGACDSENAAAISVQR